MARTAALAIFLLAIAHAAAAEFGRSGASTTAMPFLAGGVGARAVSMGEAFTAVSDDAASLHWNPAGLTGVNGRSATFMHAAQGEDVSLDHAAYAQRVGSAAVAGVGVHYLSAGSVAQYDSSGNGIGNAHPSDLALTAGYARSIAGFSAGLSAKYLRSKLVDNASGMAFDAGLMTPDVWRGRVRFGLVVANIGRPLKYDQESAPLPLVGRAGARVALSKRWAAAADAGLPKGGNVFGAIGSEYSVFSGEKTRAALRAGFNSRTADVGQAQGVAMGVGVGYGSMTVDYGFAPRSSLSSPHYVSLSYTF